MFTLGNDTVFTLGQAYHVYSGSLILFLHWPGLPCLHWVNDTVFTLTRLTMFTLGQSYYVYTNQFSLGQAYHVYCHTGFTLGQSYCLYTGPSLPCFTWSIILSFLRAKLTIFYWVNHTVFAVGQSYCQAYHIETRSIILLI